MAGVKGKEMNQVQAAELIEVWRMEKSWSKKKAQPKLAP